MQGCCSTCGGLLEFDSEHAGLVVTCPLCGQETKLLDAGQAVPVPPDSLPERPKVTAGRRVKDRSGCGCLLLMLALGLGFAWLTDGKDWADLGGLGRIGYCESIHRLAPVGFLSRDGDVLTLAYKTTRFSALLGVYLHDDGYVMAVESREGGYLPLPENYQKLQAEGLMPSPLPTYRIPAYQYVLCYAFWWVVLPLVAVSWVLNRRGNAAAKPPAAGKAR